MQVWEWILLTIGGLVLAVFLSDYLGELEHFPISYVIYIITILTVWESENFIRVLKHNSSKLLATNFVTSSDGRYISAGDYVIFTCDDIDWGFHRKGKVGAVIGPRDSVNRFGTHTVMTINPKIVNANELPPVVVDKLKEYGIQPPYRIGHVSERRELSEPTISRLTLESQEQNTFLNTLRDVSKGKFETLSDLIEFFKRMDRETKKKSWWDRFKGQEKKDEEE